MNLMNLVGPREDAIVAVAHHRVVLPASFPQLVHDLHVFVGDVVAMVVRVLRVHPHPLGRAVEVAGHDVPSDPPARQMVQRRHPAREWIRRLERERAGHAKSEMLGDLRHRRNHQHGVVDRHLDALANRGIDVAAVDVVDPEHVGDKQAVEAAALKNPREPGPVFQAGVVARAIARMRPQARRLMHHAVHIERVETNFFGHGPLPWALRPTRCQRRSMRS